jgi:hypothetical protein
MVYTIFRYTLHQGVPVVSAVLHVQKRPILVPLPFAVDTAAQQSIITPQCEAVLKIEEPSVPWEKLFKHGGRTIETILLEATFKYIDDGVALTFLSEDQTHWTVPLKMMLFSDECRIGPSRILPARHLPFSILGQDVLRQCGVLAVPKRGLITPHWQQVDGAIDRLEKGRRQNKADRREPT